MNALDMLGGFTASAGPIGGAPMGGTEASGDAGAAAGGAFESLVARALQGSGAEVEPDLTDASDADADPAESGLDLSLLLAMAGLTPFQAATPQLEDGAATGGGEAADVETVGEAGATGVNLTLEDLPCTLLPGAASADAGVGAGQAQAGEPDGEVGADAAAAEPAAAPVPPAPHDAAKAVAPVVAEMGTTAPAVGDAPLGPGVPAASPPASPSPAANAGSAAARARLAKAAPTAGKDAIEGDDAWQQAAAELRQAVTPAAGADSPAKPTITATAPIPYVPTLRPAESGDTSKTNIPDAVAPDAGLVSSTVVAAEQTMGQAGQFGQRSDRGAEEAGARTAAVSLTGARAEAAVHAFTALAAEAVPQANAAAAASAEVAAPNVSAHESAQNVQSMVRAVRMQFADGGGEARLQLNPEHLGPVTLTVKVEQGRVAAHIQAETAQASRWIETHQSNLRSALEEQGLEVRELVVTTDPDGRRDQEQSRQPAKRRTARRAEGDTPRFEILV